MWLPRTAERSSDHEGSAEPTLHDILSGPDTAHRRELETMLEDSAR